MLQHPGRCWSLKSPLSPVSPVTPSGCSHLSYTLCPRDDHPGDAPLDSAAFLCLTPELDNSSLAMAAPPVPDKGKGSPSVLAMLLLEMVLCILCKILSVGLILCAFGEGAALWCGAKAPT